MNGVAEEMDGGMGEEVVCELGSWRRILHGGSLFFPSFPLLHQDQDQGNTLRFGVQ